MWESHPSVILQYFGATPLSVTNENHDWLRCWTSKISQPDWGLVQNCAKLLCQRKESFDWAPFSFHFHRPFYRKLPILSKTLLSALFAGKTFSRLKIEIFKLAISAPWQKLRLKPAFEPNPVRMLSLPRFLQRLKVWSKLYYMLLPVHEKFRLQY